MIKAIIFDFWNTLAYSKARKNIIVEIGKMFDLMNKKFWYKPIEKGIMTEEFANKREALTKLCKIIGVEPTENTINTLTKLYSSGGIKLFSDTIPTLKNLKGKFKLVIISNTDCFSAKEFYSLGLGEYFDLVLFSCHSGLLKPDNRLFQDVLDEFRLNSKEVMMVGDNFHDDIAPALRLGMDAVLIKRAAENELSWKEYVKYDKTVNNLEELQKYLKN